MEIDRISKYWSNIFNISRLPNATDLMQYGYDDELFQAWRDGEIRRKDLPEEVVAMALDLCERVMEKSVRA